MTSIALLRLGHNVRILERSPTPLLHDQGAGIVAGGETQTFMHSYDRSQRPITVQSHQRLYLDKAGNIIHRENTPQRMTSWDLLYYLCRANFDHVKSGYLHGQSLLEDPSEGKGIYEYGRSVTKLEDIGEQVKVTFTTTRDNESVKEQILTVDFVILADGPSSYSRQQLSPSSASRKYAGYVAFRGTLPETELSPSSTSIFVEKFPFFHGPGTQVLAYTIPGENGSIEVGHRKVNWVWYVNVEEGSEKYKDIMTDKSGVRHQWTLPPGGMMRSEVWDAQIQRARELLPPPYVELVEKTRMPFVQAITDLPAPADGKCWVLRGKGVLVGDALSGFRPHPAASTSQAALHALLLPRVFETKLSRDDYEREVISFARSVQPHSVMLGDRSQFGRHTVMALRHYGYGLFDHSTN